MAASDGRHKRICQVGVARLLDCLTDDAANKIWRRDLPELLPPPA